MDKSQVGRYHHSRTVHRLSVLGEEKYDWSKKSLINAEGKRGLALFQDRRGLDVSTGLNDQISQLIGHTYYLKLEWRLVILPGEVKEISPGVDTLTQPHGSICFISGRNLSQWVTKLSWDLYKGANLVLRLFGEKYDTYLSICSRYWRMVCLKSWHFLMSKASNSFLIIREIFSKFSWAISTWDVGTDFKIRMKLNRWRRKKSRLP